MAAPVVTPGLARASLPPAAKSNSVLTIKDRGLAVNGLVNVFRGGFGIRGRLDWARFRAARAIGGVCRDGEAGLDIG